MYCLMCTGSTHAEFALAVLQLTWLDERGAHIRTDEASVIFLPKTSVRRLISTSPAHASAATVALAPLGKIAPVITHVSVRELRFLPDHLPASGRASGIEQ
jgi:hypothetical protein